MLPGGWEWVVIVGVLVLLFGATKLPQLARSLGQSARVFKAETRGMKQDEETAKKATSEPQQLASGESSQVTPPNTEQSVEDKQRNDATS